MQIGPKYKICRRLGSSVFEKCQSQKFALNQEKKAKNQRSGRRPSRTNFALQLLEKQKVRLTYGLSERQFNNYVDKALDHAGNPAENLYGLLEHRLDNVLFRLGLASTRRQARQIASHGHVLINGRRVTVPSYHVKKDDVLTLRTKSQTSPLFTRADGEMISPIVSWVEFDQKDMKGTVKGSASFDPSIEPFDLTKVIEFYSR